MLRLLLACCRIVADAGVSTIVVIAVEHEPVLRTFYIPPPSSGGTRRSLSELLILRLLLSLFGLGPVSTSGLALCCNLRTFSS